MILSLFGWAAGIVPAILDGTVRNNLVMHNTQWVPGHFHFYLVLGVLSMVLALMFHVTGSRTQTPPNSSADKIGFSFYLIGGLVFVLAFLAAGHMSVARRMATHLEQWIPTDKMGSIGATILILGMIYFAVRISIGLLRSPSSSQATGASSSSSSQ